MLAFWLFGGTHVFISTHSEELHHGVVAILTSHKYRVEVSSGFDLHTTSSDGFVMASSPECEPVFGDFKPMGRLDICGATSSEILRSLIAATRLDYSQ